MLTEEPEKGSGIMKKTYILAGTAILMWSTMATVSKLLLGTMSNFQVLCISSLLAGLSMLVINGISGKLKLLKTYCLKDYLIMTGVGMLGIFLYYSFYYIGMGRMLASQAFIINYLWPIMSILFAAILLKEKLTFRKGIAISLSFFGVIIVTGKELIQFDPYMIFGAVMCICGAVCYGAFTALNKKYHYEKGISMMVAFFMSFLLSLLLNLKSLGSWHINLGQLLGLGWNGIFSMAIGNTAWALALEKGNTAKISNLAYITPFISLIWTALILKEKISIWSVAGLCVIVLGILIQLKDQKKA